MLHNDPGWDLVKQEYLRWCSILIPSMYVGDVQFQECVHFAHPCAVIHQSQPTLPNGRQIDCPWISVYSMFLESAAPLQVEYLCASFWWFHWYRTLCSRKRIQSLRTICPGRSHILMATFSGTWCVVFPLRLPISGLNTSLAANMSSLVTGQFGRIAKWFS